MRAGECSLVYNNTLGKGIEVYSWFITLFGRYHLSPRWPADSGLPQNGHNVSAWGIPLLVLEHGRGKRWAQQYSCWCFGRICPLLQWLRDVISENICTESLCVTYTTTSCNHWRLDGVTDMNSFYIGAHCYFLNKDNYMSSKEHGADVSLHC